MTIDPVTASVIHGALETITIEMGHKLMRMAHSSIIRESEDFGAAIVEEVGIGPPVQLAARRARLLGGADETAGIDDACHTHLGNDLDDA